MGELLTSIKNLELKHRIMFFIAVMAITVFLTRITVLIKDVHPIILGFELHHFDWGLLLILIVNLLFLFGNNHYGLHLILSGIGFGWVADDIWFIRGNLNEANIYDATISLSLISLAIIMLLVFLINVFSKKSRSNKK